MSFRGEYSNKVDNKGRVAIPAAFRRVIEKGDPEWGPGQRANFVILYGTQKGDMLEGRTMESIAKLDAIVSRLPEFSKKRRLLERFLNTKSIDMQIDESGRINLPKEIRARVNITDEVKFAGMGSSFEFWAPKAYEDDDLSLAELLEEEGGSDFFDDSFSALSNAPGDGGI